MTFSDLYSKVLPMNPTNLLAVFITSLQCRFGLRFLDITTQRSFLVLKSEDFAGKQYNKLHEVFLNTNINTMLFLGGRLVTA